MVYNVVCVYKKVNQVVNMLISIHYYIFATDGCFVSTEVTQSTAALQPFEQKGC